MELAKTIQKWLATQNVNENNFIVLHIESYIVNFASIQTKSSKDKRLFYMDTRG